MFNQMWALLYGFPNKPIPLEWIEAATKFIEHYTVRQLYLSVLWVSQVLSKFLLSSPHFFLDSGEFRSGYAIMTRLSLIMIVFMLAYSAIKKMRGKLSDEQLGATIKLMLLWPIWVIFAPYLLRLGFQKFTDIAGLLIHAENMMVPDFLSISAVIGLIFFMLAFAYYCFRLTLYYGKRFIKLIILSLCAPLIFGVYCFKPQILDVWINQLLTLLFTQVIHAFVLLVVSWITIGVTSATGWYGPTGLVLQVCALAYMGEIERDVTGYIHATQGGLNEPPAIVKKGVGKLKRKANKAVVKVQAEAIKKGVGVAKKIWNKIIP